jgi:hypothetical protein
VQAAAEGDREMGEVAADADAFMESLESRSRRPGLHIVETDMGMHEVAYCLHAAPSGRNITKHIPCDLAEAIDLAVAAT